MREYVAIINDLVINQPEPSPVQLEVAQLAAQAGGARLQHSRLLGGPRSLCARLRPRRRRLLPSCSSLVLRRRRLQRQPRHLCCERSKSVCGRLGTLRSCCFYRG